MGQTITEGDMLVYIFVKLNLNINVKIKRKTTVIQNICHGAFVNGSVQNLATLSETKLSVNIFQPTLCFLCPD